MELVQPKITAPIPLLAGGGTPPKKERIRKPPVSAPALEAMYYGTPMRQDVATAREPSARELLAEKLQAQFERFMPQESAKKGARKITGYTYPMGVADITPAGISLMAYEGGESLAKAAQAAGEGEYGTAALEGLMGALGVAPAAPAVGALGKVTGKGVAGQIERAMMTGEGPLGGALAAVRPQFVTAYHGSPHQFEKFDISKIGTGEGAQAYGEGHYLAESPALAKEFRANRAYVGRAMSGQPVGETFDANWIAQNAIDVQGSAENAIDHLQTILRRNAGLKAPGQVKANEDMQKAIDLIKAGVVQPQGYLYKVDIPDEAVARMLDWNKPINEQNEFVKSLLEKAGINSESSAMAGPMAQGQEKWLAQHGIPGIKYKESGGGQNYVVFSDELPRILEVNEKPTGALPWAPGEWGRAPFQYPQAEALETARKNAVTMLGLPEENTAMDRARAMGFDVESPFYHATSADFISPKPSTRGKLGPGFYLSPEPKYAEKYGGETPQIMQMYTRGQFASPEKKEEVSEALRQQMYAENPQFNVLDWREKTASELGRQGYSGFDVGPERIVFDPAALRSRFAAFDPARINEADLLGYARPEILPYLAGVGALGGLGLAAIKDEQPKKGKKNGK